MSPKITLYYMPESPPCRAVQMTASIIGLPLELKHLDLSVGQHLSGELPKINPQKLVPTIIEETDGTPFVLGESRAIMGYLVDQYASNHLLYPTEPKMRATIDKLLYFDMGTLYKSEGDYLKPLLQSINPTDEHRKTFHSSLNILEEFLNPGPFLCGESMTIADISIRATLSFAEACEEDMSRWTRISNWMERMKKDVKDYDLINEEPVARFMSYMRMKKASISK